MKKLLALLLAVLTLLPLFVACQDTTKPGDVTTDGATQDPDGTDNPYDPKVPKVDYKEREFLFMVPESGSDRWGETSYDREEDNGDTIESAIYTRNRYVEQYFNLSKITTVANGFTGEQASAFQTYAVSGEDKIDVIATGFYQSGKPLIVNDYVLPWNNVEHINLDKSWWNKSVTETLSILGNYYYIVGDVNWFTMPETAVCYFNKVVAGANQSIVGDLYQTVKDKKWTFDTCLNIAKQMSKDNGDGKWDEQDTYGAIQNTIVGVTGFLYGADYQTVIMKDDGPQMNYSSSKMNNIVQYVVGFCNDNNVSYTEAFNAAHASKGIPIFFDDRALFYFDILLHAESFRDQESDFGIIPYPKYDEAQKEYVSYANQWGLACGLPCTASDTARTGAILEVLSARSRELIVPAYYEKTLMGKLKRDDESEEMLDIIFANILYDFGICYCTDLSYIIVKDMVESNKKTVTSWYRTKEKTLKANYQELFDHVYKQINGTKPA